MRSAVLLALALGPAAACRLTGPHVRPELPTAAVYDPAYSGEADDPGALAPAIGWRTFFVDLRLEALLEQALAYNRDLAIAAARIEEARAFYRIQRSEQTPGVEATADATRSRVGGAGGAADSAATFDRYSIAVAVPAFEIDFWGRLRSLTEAARAQYLATVEAQRALRLSLIREIAAVYLDSLEASERIRLAVATVASRREGLRIARVRLEAGITSELDFRQAESLLTQAETELQSLRLLLARSENALAVLVGAPVDRDLPEAMPLARQTEAMTVVEGLPSDLLVARPDILGAEERLRAARADVGAARAALFPSISLTGSFGYASAELSDLFGASGRAWSLGPSISLPIFDRGRRRANVDASRAREEAVLAEYELAIQTAFREVSDALAGRRHLADQVAAQERSTEAQRRIAELARIRYEEGVAAFLEVLDAERNLFATEQALLQLQRAEIDNLVALWVALGGGALEVQRGG